MFGKKNKDESESGAPKAQDGKAAKGGNPKISKGFGNTIILFIVFFIVFTVLVTGVAFFADKIDFSGAKKDMTLEDIAPKEKMTDPAQGENKEYVMDKDGKVEKTDAQTAPPPPPPPAEEKIPEAKAPDKKEALIPPPAPAPLPPVTVKPEIKKPAPKPAPAPKKETVKAAPSPLQNMSGKATTGNFVVQLASFQHENIARAEAAKLKKSIPDIFVVRADLGAKGVWYRIRCYNGISHQEAMEKAAEISKRTKYKAYPMPK